MFYRSTGLFYLDQDEDGHASKRARTTGAKIRFSLFSCYHPNSCLADVVEFVHQTWWAMPIAGNEHTHARMHARAHPHTERRTRVHNLVGSVLLFDLTHCQRCAECVESLSTSTCRGTLQLNVEFLPSTASMSSSLKKHVGLGQ